jgi:hypothetical protein
MGGVDQYVHRATFNPTKRLRFRHWTFAYNFCFHGYRVFQQLEIGWSHRCMFQ